MKSKIAAIRAAREDKGFTLIELLVVVVILVALAAIAIPVFLNQKARADEAANQSTVSSLASFISSGIANGSITSTSPVTGPGTISSNVNGNIAVPDGYYAEWDSTAGTFCVDNNGTGVTAYTYSNSTGAVTTGAC